MSFYRKVKKHCNELQNLYMSNIISYPRVDLNTDKLYTFYPHKELKSIMHSFQPIKEEKILLNKNNSLLYLNQEKLLTASKIEKMAKIIDNFYDKDLNFIDENAENKLKIYKNLLDDFLKNKKITIEKIKEKNIKKQNDEYSTLRVYKLKELKFLINFVSTTKQKRRVKDLFDDEYFLKKNKERQMFLKEIMDEEIRIMKETKNNEINNINAEKETPKV